MGRYHILCNFEKRMPRIWKIKNNANDLQAGFA